MPQVHFHSQLVNPQPLARFCTSLFVANGLLHDDAVLVTDTLVEANLRGIDSHGVGRIPHYLQRIAHGSVKPRPHPRVEKLAPAAARVLGDHGLGQIVMNRATEVALDLAREAGTGWVSVSESSHCGALAYYGLKMAEAGMVGFVFTHVDPMVIPFGAKKPFCGTNPICITAPHGGHGRPGKAVCLDMATSKAPWNTVMNAAREGVPIEPGWGVDADGNDTTEAGRVAAMYPFGSYKGSGLGLVIDILCAMLSGAPFGPDIPKMYGGDMSEHRRLGGLVGAIDIGRFVALETFQNRLSELITRWAALPPVEPEGHVLYPGEPEILERQRRLREGIPLGHYLLEEFDVLADTHGLERLPRQLPRHEVMPPLAPHVFGAPAKKEVETEAKGH